MFRSTTAAHWQSLRLNLPDTQVPDLVVEENDLVIATHGRSFYVLNDIGMLRQCRGDVPDAAGASVHPAHGSAVGEPGAYRLLSEAGRPTR